MEKTNLDVVTTTCDMLKEAYPIAKNARVRNTGSVIKRYHDLISYVSDRPGHDRRYAINCDKMKNELGWKPRYDFGEGLIHPVAWYLRNSACVDSVRSGDYQKWIETNYSKRNI